MEVDFKTIPGKATIESAFFVIQRDLDGDQ
jgi:hypothetical protein